MKCADKTARKLAKEAEIKTNADGAQSIVGRFPIQNNIIIRQHEAKGKLGAQGLILAADKYKEGSDIGTVVAVGPGKLNSKGVRLPMSVRIGDTVNVYKLAGTKIEVLDDNLWVVVEDMVQAVIE